MATKNGAGYRERIQFDEGLWLRVEALSKHLGLKPAELVRFLTAVGVAQHAALSQMPGVNAALEPVMEAQMKADVESMVGGENQASAQSNKSASSGGGRAEHPQPDHHTRKRSAVDEQLPPSYLRGL